MGKVMRTSSSGAVQLSPHFYLTEFTESDQALRHGLDNTPDPLSMANLYKVALLMEQVRMALGSQVILVSSGYRSPAVNKIVNGSSTSDHMTGSACDFRCPGFGTPLQICHALAKAGIKFGQLIQEGTWVHISLPRGDGSDGEILTAKWLPGKKKPVYVKGL